MSLHHHDLHVLTHSFPPRRTSDRWPPNSVARGFTRNRSPWQPHIKRSAIAQRRTRPWTLTPCRTRHLRTTYPPCRARLPKPSSAATPSRPTGRPEEHTSELQSLIRISYAGFVLKKQLISHT